jgi:hypothetical protein
MFTKIYKLVLLLITIALITSNVTQAQTVKKTMVAVYPAISLAIVGGAQFPVGDLGTIYKSSWNAGLDINLKLNKETSLFLNASFFDMPRKPDAPLGPDASIIAITAGPRYVFSSANVKAKFFLEAGVGAYIMNVKDYTTTTAPIVMTVGTSKVNMGANVGPGAILPLSDSMDLMIKSKLHYIFTEGGSSSFISAQIGLDFKL